MRAALLVPLFLLLSCSRPLTPGEIAFAADLQGNSVDTTRMRMVPDMPLGVATFKIEKRPRLTCRERIVPDPVVDSVTVSPAAVVLWNTVLFSEGWYKTDFMTYYPYKIDLIDMMLFAHELTHVWQWQNRDITDYSPLRAAREHQGGKDPYLFDLTTQTSFLDYAYEQQASIVEEYICCAMLDPAAPRTKRMQSMLSDAFPLGTLPRPDQILMPWDGVQIKDICR